MSALLIAGIPLALSIAGLVWYDRRQNRTHKAMRTHTPLVEHTDTEEPR